MDKNKKQHKSRISLNRRISGLLTMTLLLSFLINGCQKEEDVKISMGKPVSLTVSKTELILSQKQDAQNVLSLNWTRGTNQGTGSSISYILEIDKAGNNFSTEKIYHLGKGVLEKSFTAAGLNDLLLNHWNIESGTSASFEAKVTADVSQDGIEDGISEVISFSLTPYEPVSNVLYMVGSATPNGWDIGNATEMTPSVLQPWVFTYQGPLSTGSFKFAVSRDGCWCQDFYTKDADDDTKLVFNRGGSGEDIQWQLEEGDNYKISVDLLDLTIKMEKLTGPVFSNLYIVGDASPSGWD
ncbi:MAG: SusF/SusE family outer membrane protein, partial [Bacteroidia bacterium]|nr:SusF/SusE family outer membrane protein [Bacteroidia bacterium]